MLKFRNDRRTSELRALIEQNGQIEDIRAGAFEVSGAGVSTVLAKMQKPGATAPDLTGRACPELAEGLLVGHDGGGAQGFSKQLTGDDAIDLLRQAAAAVPGMSGFGDEWTPEDGGVFSRFELELTTGRVDKKQSAFWRALSTIDRPGALRIALARVNGDAARREAIETRLAALSAGGRP
jgi:hypothetical protein